MVFYDRLYGEMRFPLILQELFDCPGLLRLRDVRMANNQFVAFPAFANSSRYEHSLGVCYLASISAKSLGLSEKDSIELMMACLYHDVGTPPFAHAMEEVLQAKFGFNHEENLMRILEGRNDSSMGNLEQIYLGGSVKLRSVCQSRRGRSIGLDVYRVAKMITGNHADPLASLLNGGGMDWDNIDNVIRASSAMGLFQENQPCLAKRLANSFMFDSSGQLCHNADYLEDIRLWQRLRDRQYTAIYESIDDFAYQTMIKKALSLLLDDEDSQVHLSKDAWKLTDATIIHEYLLKGRYSSEIMQRVLLCKPFQCLGVLYITGKNVSNYININLSEIEKCASACYESVVGITKEGNSYKRQTQKTTLPSVVANYYPDKRKRHIRTKVHYMGILGQIDTSVESEGALLGLFSTRYNSTYSTIYSDEINFQKVGRKVVSFRSKDLQKMIESLKDSVLKEFEVSIYEKRSKRLEHFEGTDEDQLGFF